MRLLAVPVVVVVVLVGIWITGGLITNDFALAMALTTAWLAVAGVACLAVAWRRRRLRVPVIGAYLVTVAVVGFYLGRSMFLDDEVNENVVMAAPERPEARGEERPRNVLLASGEFRSVAHSATGTASAIRRARGGRVLTLTSFEVDNGPDLRVYLVAGPARDESEVDDFKDLGALKGNKGDQQYDIPRGLNLDRYSTVVIWCRAFSVNFARAPLR
ncbi:MAG: DM13 domain-containing protein [Thermoleophilaceae bacterium]|nr:DM13 domain-containing protein [Thermoleophilaceae bacterium]